MRQTPKLLRQTLLWLAVCATLAYSSAITLADETRGRVGEYQVKAAFLYHFTQFIEWPALPGPRDAMTVCVVGEDPFGAMLDFTFEDKTFQGRRFMVKRLSDYTGLLACGVLFVSRSENVNMPRILRAVDGAAVLTVGESNEFRDAGGITYLFVEQSKVRFDINLGAAKRSGLRISAQLLRLARRVEDK